MMVHTLLARIAFIEILNIYLIKATASRRTPHIILTYKNLQQICKLSAKILLFPLAILFRIEYTTMWE